MNNNSYSRISAFIRIYNIKIEILSLCLRGNVKCSKYDHRFCSLLLLTMELLITRHLKYSFKSIFEYIFFCVFGYYYIIVFCVFDKKKKQFFINRKIKIIVSVDKKQITFKFL